MVIERRKQAQLISKFFVPLKRRPRGGNTLYVGSFPSMTASGRFSAHKPNVQALPKKGPVREVIAAREGEQIVSIDFKSIEPRCLAQALLGFVRDKDQPIQEARQGNRERAKQILSTLPVARQFLREMEIPEPLPYPSKSALSDFFIDDQRGDPYMFVAQLMYPDLDFDAMPSDEVKTYRDRMKTVFLASIYGIGLTGLARNLDSTEDEARRLLTQFSEALPELGTPRYEQVDGYWRKAKPDVVQYKSQVEMQLRLTGEVTSLFGRKRRFAGLYHL